jgi:hypothetical protein
MMLIAQMMGAAMTLQGCEGLGLGDGSLEYYILQTVMVMNVVYQMCIDNVWFIVLGLILVKIWTASWRLSFEIRGGVRDSEPHGPIGSSEPHGPASDDPGRAERIEDDDQEVPDVYGGNRPYYTKPPDQWTDEERAEHAAFRRAEDEFLFGWDDPADEEDFDDEDIGNGTNTPDIGIGTDVAEGGNGDMGNTGRDNQANAQDVGGGRSRTHYNADIHDETDPTASSSGGLHPPVHQQLPGPASDVSARFGSAEETGFVFAPRHGRVYHRPGCGTLKAARSTNRYTLSIHRRLKLKPCGQCRPGAM